MLEIEQGEPLVSIQIEEYGKFLCKKVQVLFRAQQYDEAERVLSLVNYMDPSNAETWAYLALVLLKKDEPPINAAY